MALQYITFDELMASVESDLSKYADHGMINRGTCIKVVQKVNADIGLKINKEKEALLSIEHHKADLPEDFMFLQMAVACTVEHFHMPGEILGTHTEDKAFEVPATSYTNAVMNENGGVYWVAQQFQTRTVKYDRLVPLKLTSKSMRHAADGCVNKLWNNCAYDIDIDNGQVVVGFNHGKIYINYLSDMVDDKGNLLIINHPLLTEYYEYAIKKHLLENWMLNTQADVERKWGHIKQELHDARIRALSFVNTPEYTEIQNMYQSNRLRFWNKYHSMFYAH
jgi:hypothetical protein